MHPEPCMALGFPLVANQRLWNVVQIKVLWGGSCDSDCHIRAEPLSKLLQRTLQSPSACDHQLEFRDLAQCALQHRQAAEMLRFMAMLWMQNPVEIQEQNRHRSASKGGFSTREHSIRQSGNQQSPPSPRPSHAAHVEGESAALPATRALKKLKDATLGLLASAWWFRQRIRWRGR